MDRVEYIEALTFCFKAEAAGAVMGEVAMLLRPDPTERQKLDLFRRIETTNMLLCERALAAESVVRPTIEPAFYRGGLELGLKMGEGDWGTFLDNFEATIHPELFTRFQPADDAVGGYGPADSELLRHLVDHELALAEFVALERESKRSDASAALQMILDRPTSKRVTASSDVLCFVAPGFSGVAPMGPHRAVGP